MKEKSDNNAYNYLKHIEKVNNFAIVAAAVVWDRFLYNANKTYSVLLKLTLNFELLITLLLYLTPVYSLEMCAPLSLGRPTVFKYVDNGKSKAIE